MKKLLPAFALLACCGVASATTYNITMVQSGGGGFGASLFHDASGANPMSGNKVADIPNITGLLGTYDDVTGDFFADLTVVPEPFLGATPTTFTLSGVLQFDMNGVLAADSILAIDFDPAAGMPSPLVDGLIGFQKGYVCCGKTDNDPNSFNPLGNGIMSLWGANVSTATQNPDGSYNWDGMYDNKTNLGMDLRLKLEPVPVPAAVWLFGSGLLGLVGVARRKTL